MKKSYIDKQGFPGKNLLIFLLFLFLAFLTLVPFIGILLSSLRPGTEVMRLGMSLKIDPEIMTTENYEIMFNEDRYFVWYGNSLLITFIQTVLTLFVSAFVGYGFAMYDFKLKNFLFVFVLILMMVPIEIIMLPLFELMIKMKLIDTVWGVILPSIAGPLPIFFFRQYLSGLPKDFLDAARIDGCNEYGIFFRIILPLMKPSLGAMAIFVGMNSWNNYLWPLIVLRTSEKFTLPIGLASLLTPYGNNYQLLLSGAVFAIIPIVILFLFFQKYFIAGMTAGGVKG